QEVSCVLYSPDGKTLASGAGDYSIRLWELTTGKTMVTLPRPLGFSAAFSPDGKMLALAGLNGAIDLFRVPSREYIATLDRYTPSLAPCGIWQHPQRIHSVTFSPDGKTLASASEEILSNVVDACMN